MAPNESRCHQNGAGGSDRENGNTWNRHKRPYFASPIISLKADTAQRNSLAIELPFNVADHI